MNDAPRRDEELGQSWQAPSPRDADDQPAAAPKQKPDLFRGDEVEVADILVKRLTEEHGESPVCDRAKLWGYEESLGTWQPLPESELACEGPQSGTCLRKATPSWRARSACQRRASDGVGAQRWACA